MLLMCLVEEYGLGFVINWSYFTPAQNTCSKRSAFAPCNTRGNLIDGCLTFLQVDATV